MEDICVSAAEAVVVVVVKKGVPLIEHKQRQTKEGIDEKRQKSENVAKEETQQDGYDVEKACSLGWRTTSHSDGNRLKVVFGRACDKLNDKCNVESVINLLGSFVKRTGCPPLRVIQANCFCATF